MPLVRVSNGGTNFTYGKWYSKTQQNSTSGTASVTITADVTDGYIVSNNSSGLTCTGTGTIEQVLSYLYKVTNLKSGDVIKGKYGNIYGQGYFVVFVFANQ